MFGVVQRLVPRPFANQAGGYICAEFTRASLKVTPDLFLPDQMCTCFRGYAGRGTACKACPANTFTDREGQLQCEPQPRYGRLPGAPRAVVFACLDPPRCPGKGHCAAGARPLIGKLLISVVFVLPVHIAIFVNK